MQQNRLQSLLLSILSICILLVIPIFSALAKENKSNQQNMRPVIDNTENASGVENTGSGLRVLLYYTGQDHQPLLVKTSLIATGQFGAADIDILSMNPEPAPLATLLNYDCVYAYTNDFPRRQAAQGDRLKEYVDAGGRVILANFAFSSDSRHRITGGIMGPGYSPLDSTSTQLNGPEGELDFSTALTSHPMLAGVTDFMYGLNFNFSVVTLDPGAVLVGSDNQGVPLIGINAAGDVAAINVYMGPEFGSPSSPGVLTTLANACTALNVIDIDVDIKPGSDRNSINLKSKGVIPVAILTTDTFDAADVNQSTLTLEGAPAKAKGKSGNIGSLIDIDGDGGLDLVVHFQTADLNLTNTDTNATLSGETLDGMQITGTDSVNIVPKQQ